MSPFRIATTEDRRNLRPKCTKEAIKTAVKLKKSGVNNKDIALALCINERTLYKWLNEPKTELQRQLGQELKKTETDYKKSLQDIIYTAASERDWKAAAWLLERKYPQEFAKTVRLPSIDEVDTEDTDALFKSAGLDA